MANKDEGSSKVGSLLSDLLNDAKAGVAQEQKQLTSESDRRAREEREARDREEGRKREEAQQKLIEETRRRNEALSRRERNDGAERRTLGTAPHMRPVVDQPSAPQAAAVTAAPPPAKTTSVIVLAALVAVGIGIGALTGILASPTPKDAGIDVAGAAKAVVAATRKQATAEGKVLMELEAARTQIAELQKSVGQAQGAHKALAEQIAVLNKDLEKARADIAAMKPGAAPTGPKPPTKPSGPPPIKPGIF